ncbi:Putative uncharacterized protein [Propionibacterium freudenreichii subsp. freudenreichii]|jgi:hypothetical protein|uniref:Uncharacterized protein n=2 Tax=Propionibacterium freudenreichii TaxID=1744 RepID=A0A0B7NX98_PROFF|nr:hypothetical protein [Propionibacterium freudenreichii]CEG92536.1 Putative uncharacterized protein [Propionibacterium freudenreichii]CEI28059.1 Putative uncharacterized protein [Propionibacterium freudenreichii]CEP25584.1 Putative uncharacterized protein [Propionibacterium freudenreichii subsp. freudenreichii]
MLAARGVANVIEDRLPVKLGTSGLTGEGVMLDVNDLDEAIVRRVERHLSADSRVIMRKAHEEQDPDFLIYLALQYALLDDVIIPMDILDAIAVDLTDPAFAPGMLPESRKWLAENRVRTERAIAQAEQ